MLNLIFSISGLNYIILFLPCRSIQKCHDGDEFIGPRQGHLHGSEEWPVCPKSEQPQSGASPGHPAEPAASQEAPAEQQQADHASVGAGLPTRVGGTHPRPQSADHPAHGFRQTAELDVPQPQPQPSWDPFLRRSVTCTT